MKYINLYEPKKYKKFHAFLIGIIIFILLIKIFGVEFFLFDLVFDRKCYKISSGNLGDVSLKLIVRNLENIIFVFLLLRLKHGEFYKYIIVALTTIVIMFVFVNIYLSANTIGDLLAMLVLYLPKYINIYVYIITEEKLGEFADMYNSSGSAIDETKALLKIIVVIVGVTIIISSLQAVLSLIAI